MKKGRKPIRKVKAVTSPEVCIMLGEIGDTLLILDILSSAKDAEAMCRVYETTVRTKGGNTDYNRMIYARRVINDKALVQQFMRGESFDSKIITPDQIN